MALEWELKRIENQLQRQVSYFQVCPVHLVPVKVADWCSFFREYPARLVELKVFFISRLRRGAPAARRHTTANHLFLYDIQRIPQIRLPILPRPLRRRSPQRITKTVASGNKYCQKVCPRQVSLTLVMLRLPSEFSHIPANRFS